MIDVATLAAALALVKASGGGGSGEPGFSPTVEIAEVEGGTQVTITDVNGPQTFTVLNGTNGTNGVNGQDGQDGVSPVLSIGEVTTLAAGSQATASLGGTAANPTLNLGIPQGAQGAQGAPGLDAPQIDDAQITTTNPWSSMQIVNTLCPPFTVSGATVQCTPVANYPLDVQVEITPTQEGTGDPSPENVRPISGYNSVAVNVRGKNLFDVDSGFALNGDASTYGFAFDGEFFKEGVTYSLSAKNSTEVVLIKVSYASYGESSLEGAIPVGGSQQVIFHRNPNAAFPNLYVFLETGGTSYGTGVPVVSIEEAKALNLQIEAGSTPTAYEPYQPGTTATLALPETIYGGTVDVVTGTLTVTQAEIESYNGENLPGQWISDRDIYTPGTQPSIGAQVVYALAESQTIKLAPQQITALSGTNTLYADAGDITVTGASDPIATITALQNRVSALESAALN